MVGKKKLALVSLMFATLGAALLELWHPNTPQNALKINNFRDVPVEKDFQSNFFPFQRCFAEKEAVTRSRRRSRDAIGKRHPIPLLNYTSYLLNQFKSGKSKKIDRKLFKIIRKSFIWVFSPN